jgi:hypothetical protein
MTSGPPPRRAPVGRGAPAFFFPWVDLVFLFELFEASLNFFLQLYPQNVERV